MNTSYVDIFAEYEAELLAKTQAEIAKENAEWAALPQAEKDRISAARQAKLESFFDCTDEDDVEDEDEDEE